MHDVTGLTGAAPIWHETIRTLLQGKPEHEFEQPEGIVQADVCSLIWFITNFGLVRRFKKNGFWKKRFPQILMIFIRKLK